MRRKSLGNVLLAYLSAVTGLITLAPFRFRFSENPILSWTTHPFDFLTNSILFAPLGFVYEGARSARPSVRALSAFTFGLSFSFLLETAQLYLPGRFTSPADMAANALGAWMGAVLFRRVRKRLDERLVRKLALELPLMSILYLLIPLLWLNGFLSAEQLHRPWVALPLTLFAVAILNALWKHRLGVGGSVSANEVVGAFLIWFLVANFPLLSKHAGFVIVAGAALALGLRLMLGHGERRPAEDCRFELPALLQAAPYYACYLLLRSLGPQMWKPASWKISWGVSGLRTVPGVFPVLGLVEHAAAFTLVGYMAAEARGRRSEPAWRRWAWVLIICGTCSAFFEAIRGFHPLHESSFSLWGIALAAAVFGALLYRLQLDTVRQLREPVSGMESPASMMNLGNASEGMPMR